MNNDTNTSNRNHNTASWAKLRDGSWGIRVNGQAAVGDVITVIRANGVKSTQTITRVVWAGDDATLCEVAKVSAPVTEGATTRRAPAKPAKPRGWRPCGYPGCNPSYCDECDGKGAGVGFGSYRGGNDEEIPF